MKRTTKFSSYIVLSALPTAFLPVSLMMSSLPVAIDAMCQTITVHVINPNGCDVTWVVEVTFVSWDGENRVKLGCQVVNMFIAI
jgi:hypothetical protein